MKAYVQLYQVFARDKNKIFPICESICSDTLGVLKSMKSEVEAGLVGNMELQAQGGIFGDFITLARESLDENMEVAAVFVSAALEDALKRFALQNGLDVDDANMDKVISALKGKGLLKDPQASIVWGHAKLRNKAFHANWDKIEKESVNSAIGFTEEVCEKFGFGILLLSPRAQSRGLLKQIPRLRCAPLGMTKRAFHTLSETFILKNFS